MNLKIEVEVKGLDRLAQALESLLGGAVNITRPVLDNPEQTSPKSDAKQKADKKPAKTVRSLDELRELAISKANDGKADAVKRVIASHDLQKITEAPVDKIDVIYADIKEL